MSTPEPTPRELDGYIELAEASIARSELFMNLLAERFSLPKGNVYDTLARLKDLQARKEVPNV